MKNLLFAVLGGILVTLSLPAATDVSGKWSGFPIYLTLNQDGNTVTGSAGESEDDQIPFQNGSIENDRVTLTFGPTELVMAVQGDQMTGEVHMGERTMKMVFKRIKPRDPSAPPPAFDAATVKRSAPSPMGKGNGSNMHADPGRLTCTNVPLRQYIVRAWNLKEYQVVGPDWLKDERYDLTATMPAGTPPHEVFEMFQGLLTDRFRISTHRETREMAVYALVVEKSGPRLKQADGFGGMSISSSPKGRSMRANATMKTFAATLSNMVDKPVIDMTELPGGFTINLDWTPDDMQEGPKSNDVAGDSTMGPTIFTALHEVGLKLEARKAPVEILVVDKAEKIPAEN
jgi:uncharacterized protein (TIGR03435 family)